MTQRAASCAALATALLCTALPARAEKETIALDYQVGAGCPDRAQFVERVRTFTTKAEIVNDSGASLRKFDVQVLRSGSAVRGELTIDDRGAKTTRNVSGATCDEVISALALATAIAVDPDALGGGGTPPDEGTKPPVTEPPAPPKQKPPPEEPPPTPPPAQRRNAPVVEPPRPPMLYLAAGARIGSALAPFAKYEGTAELGFSYFTPVEFYVGGAYGPKQTGSSALGANSIRVSEWLGWAGGGYRLFELEPLSVSAQASFEVGRVETTGQGIEPSFTAQRLWLAVDVGLGAHIDAPGPLFFQANVGARAPLLLQGYDVQDMTNAAKRDPVYQVRHLGYLLGLSVGVHFL